MVSDFTIFVFKTGEAGSESGRCSGKCHRSARLPFDILEKLFTANDYSVSELVSLYKIQSEPEDTLLGYAQDEKNGIEFDFYDHEKAWPFWLKELESKRWTTPELKEALKPFRISAKQAFDAFEKEGKQAGHICSIFKATL